MSFEYMNEFIQNLPCVNNMCSSERHKLRRVLHFFSNYTAIDDNDVFYLKDTILHSMKQSFTSRVRVTENCRS